MTDFVEKVTGLPRDEAFKLQKAYLAEHGLTLKGLMLHHGVDPDDFHAIFHDLSLEAWRTTPTCSPRCERLPGRRLIFTNADDRPRRARAGAPGPHHLFDDVFHIGSAGYAPKPSAEAFARMTPPTASTRPPPPSSRTPSATWRPPPTSA
jgi:putative hydrolase of the HAD superfamily